MPKAATKLSLADLLDGKAGKANADLYKGDAKKRKNHIKNRVDRARLMTVKGGEYKRRLSGDVAMDIKYHELAREFISNGFKQSAAYAAVFGSTKAQGRHRASEVFNSAWMRALILEMVQGTDDELAETPKEYLFDKLEKQIESNVLDYIDNDGSFLNVKELKSLPLFTQQIIKKLNVHTWHMPVMEGEEQVAEIRHQRVQIELYDKQKALELLAKAKQWIASVSEGDNIFINAQVMIAANKRIEKFRRDDIEGEYETTTPD